MARRSEGRRRSLLDEMEHDESSRRQSEHDDFGVPQRFDQVFIGGGDYDDDDYDEEDDLLLMGVGRRQNRHLRSPSNHDDGDESSSTGVYSPLHQQLVLPHRRSSNSTSNNDLGTSTSSHNRLDPLYERFDEMVVGGGETFVDSGYKDPDAATPNNSQINTERPTPPFPHHRPLNDHSMSTSGALSDLSSSENFTQSLPPSPRSAARKNLQRHSGSRRATVGEARPSNALASSGGVHSASARVSSGGGGGRKLFKTAILKHTTFLHGRSSTRDSPTGAGAMTDAVSRLSSSQSHELDRVAAASAVVASSTPAPLKRGVQFSRGDDVLVVLTRLGMADDAEGEKCTVDPVNAHGYPQGQGKTEVQRNGPYLYVLCQVTQVHFDEDERYYTVRRCDNNKEQRADQAYMEAIRDENAVGVALRAAQRTERETKPSGRVVHERRCSEWYRHWVEEIMVPWYRQKRMSAKAFVKHILNGDHGYAIKLSFTSINLLVLCSLIFLFIDVLTISLLSAEWDNGVAVVGM